MIFLAYLTPNSESQAWSKFDVSLQQISGSVKITEKGFQYYDRKAESIKYIPLHSILHIEQRYNRAEQEDNKQSSVSEKWKNAVVYYHKQEIEFSTNYVVRVNHPGKNPYGFECWIRENKAPHYIEVYTPNFGAKIIIPYWLVKGIVYKDVDGEEAQTWLM